MKYYEFDSVFFKVKIPESVKADLLLDLKIYSAATYGFAKPKITLHHSIETYIDIKNTQVIFCTNFYFFQIQLRL